MTKKRYIKGFDGLRALAVIGVIAFHLMPDKLVGGWLGVPLFFVLSGYLITDLLIQEFDDKQRIAAVTFYMRRLKRLYPALLGMLLLSIVIILLFDQQLIYNLRYTVVTNLLYVYNFWAIGQGESYFQQFGGASPFMHLWSLSIEGQFYLIWPFIVWWLLKKQLKRPYIAIMLLFLSLLSAIAMAVLYQPEAINRAYYGTDTRMFAILIGTSLAFLWPSNRLNPAVQPKTRDFLNTTGTIAFILTICGFLWLNGQHQGTYYGLMYLFTLVVAILIAVTAHPASWYGHLLDQPILNYLGTRSYSIYLYQLPVFVFYEKLIPNYQPNLLNMVIEVAIVLLLSELSYRFVENIFRQPAAFKLVIMRLARSRNLFFAVMIALVCLTVFIGNGLLDHRAGMAQPETKLQKQLKSNQQKVAQRNAKAAQGKTNKHDASESTKLTPAQQTIISSYGLKKSQYLAFKEMSFTAIGDSVMLDAAPYLQEVNENIFVDAAVGRQSYQTPDLVAQMSSQGKLASNIVIGLGTNGDIKRQDLDKMMQTFGKKRQVYWFNNFVQSRSWQNDNNQMLADAQKQYSNLHVIDWFDLAKQHLDWFADDGVHPGPTGDRNYVRLLVESVARTKNSH
ncbi:acyltransferase family protein [Leuconostoc citreum]|uniref:acyltransferase family protein n=1 Tax=Leuconostoc citreum TaxID=33964 RepID=UPI000BFEB401|nr:acyltransferase family protein [Leuconostoc citreum]